MAVADEPLRAAILAILGARPIPARRRALADQLQALADEQWELAAADERVGHVARRAALDQARPGARGGRPKGSGARFIRVEEPHGEYSGRVHIGRALWQELGEPVRLDVQRIGSRLELRPVESGGYSVTRPRNGMPRFSVGQETLDTLRVTAGRYRAEVRGGAIVVGVQLE